jgi:hypothetical protein
MGRVSLTTEADDGPRTRDLRCDSHEQALLPLRVHLLALTASPSPREEVSKHGRDRIGLDAVLLTFEGAMLRVG